MPIRIPQLLPAREILEDENIFVMEEGRARTQDIRPLNILILNLMPQKKKRRYKYCDCLVTLLCRSISPF